MRHRSAEARSADRRQSDGPGVCRYSVDGAPVLSSSAPAPGVGSGGAETLGSAETLGGALRRAAAALGASASPRLDAELLLGHVLSRRSADVLACSEEALRPDDARRFDHLVARRAEGEPIAYILGVRGFFGLELRVTPDVLIPRPETEQLAEWAVERLRARGSGGTLLDVGTGSGALALACVSCVPGVQAHATEASAAALRVAADNARRLGLVDRVTWHEADLLPRGSARFDVVVANLPYIALHEVEDVSRDVIDWEPHLALFGGDDGLVPIRRLLRGLPARLTPGADVGLEIGWRQGAAVLELVAEALPGARAALHHDLAGHPRVVTAEGFPGT